MGTSPTQPESKGKCPVCRQAVARDNPFRPFCRHRCKMVDLGRWFRGEYVIPGEDAIEMDPEQFAEGLRDLERRAEAEASSETPAQAHSQAHGQEDDDEGGGSEPEA